jgi:G3E family GTPase
MTDRLKLTILGGFLGAGKTTWLRHQLHEGRFISAHLIVNEAARTPIDHHLLTQAAGQTVIADGCACCTAAEMLRTCLRTLCDARSAGRGPDQILLETSGLADPARIATMILSDPVLSRHLALAEVAVIVDAAEGPARIACEPLARAQIAAADRIILTKIDQTQTATVGRLRATIRALAPAATIEAAVQGVPIPLGPEDAAHLPLDFGKDDTAPIEAHVIDLSETDWPNLSVWLSALIHARGGDIMRIKGFVDTPAGPLLLQSVGARMQPPERMDGATGQLVLIGRGTSHAALARSLARWSGR